MFAVGAALGGCVVLVRRPWVGVGLLLAGTVAYAGAWGLGELSVLQFLAVDVAIALVAAVRARGVSLPAAGAALVVLGVCAGVRWGSGAESGTASEPYVALTVVVAWLVGRSVHQSRGYEEEVRRQFSEQVAARAVASERLRIARELHDSVAHSIGIIALQAGAAARVVQARPDEARVAMVAVERAGREALAGLRRMLGALREVEEGGGAAPLDPLEGLVGIERLAAQAGGAGVVVEVSWRGERRPLPQEVDFAAFRIVQESVTNVIRHAGTGSCRVVIAFGAGELGVEVTDGGAGPAERVGVGYGLIGMRERVALLGGEFCAGGVLSGGFRVAATLPLGPGGGAAGL
ncbi:sensor histidine kinase [Streptomyces sp. SBC-4]|nr:sensor histidine kinase [Streptomyces sp. SBC-4]MDV5143330.1 sensor histidine kinase [Streptomyces sp. SBC-4]